MLSYIHLSYKAPYLRVTVTHPVYTARSSDEVLKCPPEHIGNYRPRVLNKTISPELPNSGLGLHTKGAAGLAQTGC